MSMEFHAGPFIPKFAIVNLGFFIHLKERNQRLTLPAPIPDEEKKLT